MAKDADATQLISERLNKLFEATGESTANVAAAVSSRGSVSLTRAYLHSLRAGTASNPSYKLLAAIADHFDVSIDYFADTDAGSRIEKQIDQLVVLRDQGVTSILLRNLEGLSPEGLRAVLDTLRVARFRDGLSTADLDKALPPEQ